MKQTRFPLLVSAPLIGFLVSSAGIAAWTVCLKLLPAPWSILVMIPVLWVYWRLFTRKYAPLPWTGWAPKLGAALLFVLIVQASFVVTFCLIPFPSERFAADYKELVHLPAWTAWGLIIMGSIVAGICEETGFRGYLQSPLAMRYGPSAAILLTSVCFTLIHLSHSWAAPILPQIFFASILLGLLAYRSGSLLPGIIGHSILDIFDYSLWWTTITGRIERRTIFVTGMDAHFVGWVLALGLACWAFFKVINTPTFTKH